MLPDSMDFSCFGGWGVGVGGMPHNFARLADDGSLKF